MAFFISKERRFDSIRFTSTSGREMLNKSRFEERIEDFQRATIRLHEACEQTENSFIRDSVIQRFEFCWELAWKVLRFKLLEVGIEASNPRSVFQEALVAGLIRDGNRWTEAQRMRNLTSHTYDEALAKQVYKFIVDEGLPLFVELAETTKGWGK